MPCEAEGLVQLDDVDCRAGSGRCGRAVFARRGSGPMPMMRGSTPAVAMATMRARGVKPWRLAASALAMSRAAAPSLTPEALPAVTVPGLRNWGFEFLELVRGWCRGGGVRPGLRRCVALATLVRAWDGDGGDLAGEEPGGLGGAGFLLGAEGELVLGFAGDLELLGDVPRRFRAWSRLPYMDFIRPLTKRQPMVVS